MKRGGFLVLLAAFVVAALVWRQRADELGDDRRHVYDHALLPDLKAERVHAIRIDNVERGWQVLLERDAGGVWYLTDPLAFPADRDLVQKLLTVLGRERGQHNATADAASLGFTPPRVVVTLEETGADGAQSHRVEVGAYDVDPSRVYARVPGHPASPDGAALLRVSRALDNVFQRNPDAFRDTRVTPFLGAQVQRLERFSDASAELALDMRRGDGVWRTGGEHPIQLDPGAAGVLVRCAAELRARGFLDDRPDARERRGFDEPRFGYRLTTREGDAVEVLLQRDARGQWIALASDGKTVVQLQHNDVQLLRRPAATLYDTAAVRWLRERVQRITLRREEQDVVLLRTSGPEITPRRGDARVGETWEVRTDGGSFPADIARVEDLLAALERVQIATFVPGVSFSAEEARASFVIETDDGDLHEGWLGPPYEDPKTGVGGELYRRGRENAFGLVAPGLLEVLSVPLDELRPLQVHRVPERFADRIELSVAGAAASERQVYVRDGADWHPFGLELPASNAFLEQLDPLLALRVVSWLDGEAELDPRVEVVVSGSFGEPLRFALGHLPDGQAACTLTNGSTGRVAESLVAGILGLFESS